MKEGKILQTIPKSAWPDPAEIQVWHVLQHSLKYHTRQNWCGGRETARSPSLFNPFSTHTPEGFHLLSPKNLLYRESYFPPQNPQNWLCRLQLRAVDPSVILSPKRDISRSIWVPICIPTFAGQALRRAGYNSWKVTPVWHCHSWVRQSGPVSLEYWRKKYATIISFFISASVDKYEMSTAALGLSSITL